MMISEKILSKIFCMADEVEFQEELYIKEFEERLNYIDELCTNNNPKQAIKELLQMLDEYSEETCAFIYYKLSTVYSFNEDRKNALKSIKKAISIDPENSLYYANLGYIYEVAEKLDKAEKAYIKAIQTDATSELALYYWADFLENKRQNYIEAENVTKELLAIDYNNGNYHRLYADILNDLEFFDAAQNEYLLALKLEPENDVFLNNYGVFFLNSLDDPHSAKSLFIKALQINPNSKLYKENLLLAIKNTYPIYGLFWNITKFTSKHGIWALLLIPFIRILLKTSAKTIYGMHHLNPVIYNIVTGIIIFYLIIVLYMALINPILSILIKLKILK